MILGEELSGSIVIALVLVCAGVYLVNQGGASNAIGTRIVRVVREGAGRRAHGVAAAWARQRQQ